MSERITRNDPRSKKLTEKRVKKTRHTPAETLSRDVAEGVKYFWNRRPTLDHSSTHEGFQYGKAEHTKLSSAKSLKTK